MDAPTRPRTHSPGSTSHSTSARWTDALSPLVGTARKARTPMKAAAGQDVRAHSSTTHPKRARRRAARPLVGVARQEAKARLEAVASVDGQAPVGADVRTATARRVVARNRKGRAGGTEATVRPAVVRSADGRIPVATAARSEMKDQSDAVVSTGERTRVSSAWTAHAAGARARSGKAVRAGPAHPWTNPSDTTAAMPAVREGAASVCGPARRDAAVRQPAGGPVDRRILARTAARMGAGKAAQGCARAGMTSVPPIVLVRIIQRPHPIRRALDLRGSQTTTGHVKRESDNRGV